MAEIKGKWRWNETVAAYEGLDYVPVEFFSYGVNYKGINFLTHPNCEIEYEGLDNSMTRVSTYEDGAIYIYDEYRDIDFGFDLQDISEDVYNYILANAKRQKTITEKIIQAGENEQLVYDAGYFYGYEDGYEKGKSEVTPGEVCNHNILDVVEILPDFSNGDFTESLPDSYYAHAAKILKPVNLTPANIAKGVNIGGVVGTHEGGGGSVEGTATVTFCNYDGTEPYSRLVFIGDDCADPITQNKLDTPTRDSDVQYHYTFNGWSTTQGGTASSTALKNITTDKTVYAAFSTSLVYYTVRFYDGDTLMQESQVGYGETATPPDIRKDGHQFVGWTPNDLVITGDTDFYGEWNATPYLAVMPEPTGGVVFDKKSTKLLYTNDGERLIGLQASSGVNSYNLAIYDATTTPYKYKQRFDIGGNHGMTIYGVLDMALNPSNTMLVVSRKATSTSNTPNIAYSVFSISDQKVLTDVTSTYYTPTGYTSSASYENVCFNCDGTRMVLINSSNKAAHVYDTTTTPFTLLGTINNVYSGGVVFFMKAHPTDPNIIYYSVNGVGYGFGMLKITELTRVGIVNNSHSCSYASISPSCDILYMFDSRTMYVYQFDTTTNAVGDSTIITAPSALICCVSPDGKKFLVNSTEGIQIYKLENNTFSRMADPDTRIGASDVAGAFDASGTKLATSSVSTSPYLMTYVVDPTVDS